MPYSDALANCGTLVSDSANQMLASKTVAAKAAVTPSKNCQPASQTIFMTDHRRWAIATAVIWWFIAVLEAGRTAQGKKAHLVIALALVAAIGPLAVTGWKGAELVYRNGIGIVATLGSVPR